MNETVAAARIVRFSEIEPTLRPGIEAGIDRIFFVSSSVQSFPSDDERAAFRDRWLGRYLRHDPRWAYLALPLPPRGGGREGGTAGPLRVELPSPQLQGFPPPLTPPHKGEGNGGARVAGYVIGAIDDPAKAKRFADIPYFQPWAHLTAQYPAHLHINVALEWRSSGVGSRLIEAFAADARAAGAPGVHVVTGEGMRNVGFYLRNGFEHLATLEQAGKRPVVFLGRRL